jgi:ribose transport system ATP-binding protein
MTLRSGSGQAPGRLEPRPQFSMRGIRKAFGGTVAVDGIDLDVFPGEVCALVGQNGAGKSTLMAVLAGALQADAGEMTLEGKTYRPRSPLDARRAGVTMIYQELSLAPHVSVMENISLGVEPTRFGFVSHASTRAIATRALHELGHGTIDPDAPASSLSVAEQQIVEIARALATGCRVLVLDEPTSSLGHEDVERLFALIERFKAQGRAIVYVSHFLEEVTRIADRVVVLRDGRIAGEGTTGDLTAAEMVRLMVGRRVDDLYPRRPRRIGELILEVEPLTAGSEQLALHRGEVVGVAGLVGAGRTRFLRGVFGLEPVASGRVRLGGVGAMGLLSEDRKGEGLALGLSVADNVTLSKLSGLGPGSLIWPHKQRAAAETWIDRLGVRAKDPAQPVEELSGGNQQKIAFARLLHQDVDVLLLDEPTRGVDVASKAQIYELIDRLVSPASAEASAFAKATADKTAGKPKAVLMVSSYLPELLGLCDRIAVMQRGRLGPARPVTEWDESRLMLAATGAGEPM